MRWQAHRGVLNPLDASPPGSVWWRAVNERLLRDGCESVALVGGLAGEPSSRPVRLWLEFIARPTGRNWYRAHNASIVGAYLDYSDLAEAESTPERFFMNVALVRVLTRIHSSGRRALRWDGSPCSAACSATPASGWPASFLTPPRAPIPLSARARRGSLHRRRAAPWPAARLRGDRAAVATHIRVVRRGARGARSARLRDGNPVYAWPFEERHALALPLTCHGSRGFSNAPPEPGETRRCILRRESNPRKISIAVPSHRLRLLCADRV